MTHLKYSKKVMDNFMHPKNMGEIKNADGIGKVGNPACGDVMWVYIKVGRKKDGAEFLKDVKFKTFGCAAAIASSSMLTQLAKGKSIGDARKIQNKDVAKELKGLPPVKVHCSNLAADALQRAIEDYETGFSFRKRKAML
jgi:nitrogen fixation protein NifU and related proteins